jgi:hypothetical protein
LYTVIVGALETGCERAVMVARSSEVANSSNETIKCLGVFTMPPQIVETS